MIFQFDLMNVCSVMAQTWIINLLANVALYNPSHLRFLVMAFPN